jgi:hypothetical protein
MFFPAALICLNSICITVVGPSFPTHDGCMEHLYTTGLNIVANRYPSHEIVGARCFEWPSGS